MRGPSAAIAIDARPRGPSGLLAAEPVLGRPVLAHLIELAAGLNADRVAVYARQDDHARLGAIVRDLDPPIPIALAIGPPPADQVVLRTDRLYDLGRLGRAIRRGRDPEAGVVWRLDRPHALAGADDELIRRRSFQPIGRYWARGPACWLAARLAPTAIRPNHLTIASALVVLASACLIASTNVHPIARGLAAAMLALGLVLDTADGHLARLQGTASRYGRWLDGWLDEVGDLALHAAIAWAASDAGRRPLWLAIGMAYPAGKYLFVVGASAWEATRPATNPASRAIRIADRPGPLRQLVELFGHADIRWHAWIALAACGLLRWELIFFSLYYPARAAAGLLRRGAADA